MKILVFIHEYPPVGGGGGRVAQNLSRGLHQMGYEIQVISSHYKQLPKIANENGILVHRVKCARKVAFKASFLSMGLYVLSSFWKGLAIIRKWKPDLLHAHFAVPAGAPVWALSKISGIPYIITAHGGDVPGAAPEKTDLWFRFILPFTHPIWKHARRVVAVSEHFFAMAKKYYPVDMEIIPNGFALEGIHPGKYQSGKIPLIVYAGRFSPEKNPLMIVHSLAELKELKWKCAILGDGVLMAEMQRIIERLKLKNRFHLPGWVSEEQVMAWMAKSDILFMPSLAEGLPIAGLQALAMGLAMVLSRVGGCVNLIKPGRNGFLVEPGDLRGYVEALHQLLTKPELLEKFRKASLSHSQQFQMNAVISAYDQLIQEVTKKP